MLNEMCLFVDECAKYWLGERFNPRWPEYPDLRNEVYIDNILSLVARKEENVLFVVYEPASKNFSVCEKEEVIEMINTNKLGVIRAIVMNPSYSSSFYDERNKWLGSTGGINSFFPFIFVLPEENEIERKMRKTKGSLSRYNAAKFEEIFDDKDFLNGLKKKIRELSGETKEKKVYILILFDKPEEYTKFLKSEEILKNIITSTFKKEICQLCGEKGVTGYPIVGSSYDAKKIFLRSPTKGDGRISVCPTCGFKINAFYKLLKQCKVLPVFVDRYVTTIAAENIREYLRGEEGYEKFMNRVYEKLGKKDEYKMAHYLMSIIDNVIWVDYVASLKWVLEWESFEGEELEVKRKSMNRMEIERIFYASIFKKGTEKFKWPFRIYFGNLKEWEGKLGRYGAYLLYRYRDLLYRFVYKNDVAFSKNEIIEFVNLAITQKYYDVLEEGWTIFTFGKSIIAPLEIFFNSVWSGGDKMEGLEELRRKLDEVVEKENVQLNEEEWAYCAGAFYRYLVSQSKSKEPPLELEPLVNASRVEEVLDVIVRTFERYQHSIKQQFIKKWGNIASSALIPKDRERDFEELKPFFYAGFIDPFASEKFWGK
ncbi:MAG: hypothetical protein QXF56_01085 [Candidatus Micrarchaeia archaeon]